MWNRGEMAVAKHSFTCDCGRALVGGSVHRVEHVEYVSETVDSNGEYLMLRGDDGHYWWHDHFRKLKSADGEFTALMRKCTPLTEEERRAKERRRHRELEPAE